MYLKGHEVSVFYPGSPYRFEVNVYDEEMQKVTSCEFFGLEGSCVLSLPDPYREYYAVATLYREDLLARSERKEVRIAGEVNIDVSAEPKLFFARDGLIEKGIRIVESVSESELLHAFKTRLLIRVTDAGGRPLSGYKVRIKTRFLRFGEDDTKWGLEPNVPATHEHGFDFKLEWRPYECPNEEWSMNGEVAPGSRCIPSASLARIPSH